MFQHTVLPLASNRVQALCIAACYPEDWPLLIICPATMKLVWREAGELWRQEGGCSAANGARP